MRYFKIIVIGLVFLVVAGLTLGWFGYLGGNPAAALETSATLGQNKLSALAPFRVTFARPVNRTAFDVHFSPDIEAAVSFEDPLFGRHLYRTLVVTPLYGWKPGQQYTLTMRGIRNAVGGGEQEAQVLQFAIEDPPRVLEMSFNGPEDQLSITPVVTVKLDKPRDATSLVFETTPAVEWTVEADVAGTLLTLKPTRPLEHNTSYALSVFGTVALSDGATVVYQGEQTLLYKRAFHTRAPYAVKSWSPVGTSVDLRTPVTIDFGASINEAELRDKTIIRITPNVAGDFVWNDAHSLVRFIPKDGFAPDTFYSVELGRDLCFARENTQSRVECRFAFRTVGPVKVSSVFPSNGMVGVDVNTSISIAFDQDIEKASAEERFKLEPTTPGIFLWNEQTMTFKPASPLRRDTSYVIKLEPGVRGFTGEPLARLVEVPFNTELATAQLDVALDYQDHALSCEAAALKMALSYFDIAVSEGDIMNVVGYDPTPHRGNVWGDPHEAFVGNIDGKQNTTGYGVYWEPMAVAAKRWRPYSEYFTGWTLQQMLAAVKAGQPVMLWGVYPGGSRDSWMTPEGKEIKAWKGEHTRLIIGFTGTIEKPTRVVVLDPFAGKQFWNPDDLIANGSSFDMSGVVVR